MHLLSYVRVKERPGKKLRRAHILLFLSLTVHLGLTRPSRHWVGQLGEEKKKQCGDFWTKKGPKFFCINSVRRFFLLKCVQHACVTFRSLLLMSNLGLLGHFPNRNFYFILFQHICVISETGKQKYKAWKQSSSDNRALKCFVYWVLSFTGFSSGTPATLVECPSPIAMCLL